MEYFIQKMASIFVPDLCLCLKIINNSKSMFSASRTISKSKAKFKDPSQHVLSFLHEGDSSGLAVEV